MVSVIDECRMTCCTTFGWAPVIANHVPHVCRSEWKSSRLPSWSASANGLSGTTFATEVQPTLRGVRFLGVLYNPNDVTLVAAGVLGDYNRNGVVDAADYVVWRKTFSGANVRAANLAADGDGNRDVDQGDFIVWRFHFGQIVGSGAGIIANAAVP